MIPAFVAGATVVALAIILAVVWVFQVIWNGVMPELFGLPHLTYLHAVSLFVIARLLFGSWGAAWKAGK